MRKNLFKIALTSFATFGVIACSDNSTGAGDSEFNSSSSVQGVPASSETVQSTPASSETVQNVPASSQSSRIVLKNDPYGFWAIDRPFPEVNVCGDFWCGPEGKSQAKTGLEEETGGYWYIYGNPKDYESKWIFVGETYAYEEFFGPLADAYGGISAKTEVSNNSFVGLGFNIVNGDQAATDVSEWGGLCLAYASSVPFTVEVGIPNEAYVMEGGHFAVTVPASEALTVVDLPWEKSQMKASVVGMHFEKSGKFFLYSFGRAGSCGQEGVISNVASDVSSSSSDPNSSSSVATGVKKVFLWDALKNDKVDAGSPDETAGWWYQYDDSDNGGTSSWKWDESGVEQYGGLKGSAEIGTTENAFAGIGFNIWDEDQTGVDVTKWDGLCLIYSSTSDFVVELGIENEAQVTEGCNPVLDVRKSDSLTMVKLPWSKLYASCGRGDLHDMSGLLQTVAAIKLKFTKSSDLLLRAVGSLEECKIRN